MSFDAVVGTTLGNLAPLLPRRSFQFGHVVFEIRYLRLACKARRSVA